MFISRWHMTLPARDLCNQIHTPSARRTSLIDLLLGELPFKFEGPSHSKGLLARTTTNECENLRLGVSVLSITDLH